MSDEKPRGDRDYAHEDDYGRRRMPSTETRRYADLITLIRDIVADAAESKARQEAIKDEIWELAGADEKEAIMEFTGWFEVEPINE